MSFAEITIVDDGQYEVQFPGDEHVWLGNFATAVEEYIEEARSVEAYMEKSGRTLFGCVEWFPINILERTIVALWDTVPKLEYSPKYADMLAEVSAAVAYLQSGDKEIFEDVVNWGVSKSKNHIDVFSYWSGYLDEWFGVAPVNDTEEDLHDLLEKENIDETEEEDEVITESFAGGF